MEVTTAVAILWLVDLLSAVGLLFWRNKKQTIKEKNWEGINISADGNIVRQTGDGNID